MCFFGKLCAKHHDYLVLIDIDLIKRKHKRVSKCGVEEFQKGSKFYKKLLYKQEKKLFNISKKITTCSANKKYFFRKSFCKTITVHGIPQNILGVEQHCIFLQNYSGTFSQNYSVTFWHSAHRHSICQT